MSKRSFSVVIVAEVVYKGVYYVKNQLFVAPETKLNC